MISVLVNFYKNTLLKDYIIWMCIWRLGLIICHLMYLRNVPLCWYHHWHISLREALILAVYLLNGSKVTWCRFIKSDTSQVCNYRPISLLCIVSKVMEKCLHNNIIDSIKPLIHPLQHDFMNGKSCTARLLDVYGNVGRCLDEGKQMDMIFLYFSTAFNSVNAAT